jgi:hypothetical protein
MVMGMVSGSVRFFLSAGFLSYLIAMIKASEAFPGPDPDGQVKEVKNWLKSKGVRDFEPVSLYCDQLTKVN